MQGVSVREFMMAKPDFAAKMVVRWEKTFPKLFQVKMLVVHTGLHM